MAHKRGFTLIEVIISTALLAIITLGFLQMTVGVAAQINCKKFSHKMRKKQLKYFLFLDTENGV